MEASTEAPSSLRHAKLQLSVSFGATAHSAAYFRTAVSLSDLFQVLTTFKVGVKDGDAFAPALFANDQRSVNNAERIEVMGLDIDAGYPVKPVIARLKGLGITGAVYTTFSHTSTATAVPRKAVEGWRQRAGSGATDARYLREMKGYVPDIAESCASHEVRGDTVIFQHAPIPKFRIVLPLAKPWVRSDFPSDSVAGAAWRHAVEAAAAMLGITVDPAARDVARLFYLPRIPSEAARGSSISEIIDGELFDALEQVNLQEIERHFAKIDARIKAKASRSNERVDPASVCHTGTAGAIIDPINGQALTLDQWLVRWGSAFQIADTIAAGAFEDPESGEVFCWPSFGWRGRALLCECPNFAQHTVPSDKNGKARKKRSHTDFAAFNASDTSRSSGFAFHCFHAHCASVDRKQMLELALQAGWISPRALVDPRYLLRVRFDQLQKEFEAENDPRPIIRLEPGEMAKMADIAEKILVDALVPFFNRGGVLVTPYVIRMKSFHGRVTCSPALARITCPMVLDRLTRLARVQRWDSMAMAYVPANPPKWLAETILNRPDSWRFRRLSGIIATPSLRPDGTLLATEGYDPETQLLLVDLPAMPEIPDNPTKADAEAALDILDGLFTGFPFVNAASRSVALSAVLTPVCRAAMEVVPMHVSSAPTAGTGKSYLWDVVSAVAIGQRCPVTTAPKSPDELEKRLDGSLLEGIPIICIDNVSEELGSDKLCVAIERPIVDIRRLGASDKQKVENRSTIFATGNNIQLRGDVTRRALLALLDAEMERPELREFNDRPHEAVIANRGKYVAAALRVVRAYIVAGRPKKLRPLASFEDWSRTVREALVWLGRADPVDTMVAARDEDPELAERREVIVALQQVFGTDEVTVREMIDAAEETVLEDPNNEHSRRVHHYPDLRSALMQVASERGRLEAEKLGRWMRSNKGRIVAGQRLVRASGPNVSPAKWAIRPVTPKSGG